MLLLSEAEVREVLPMPDLIEGMQTALAAFSNGEAQQPPPRPAARPAAVQQQDTTRPRTPQQIVLEKVRKIGQQEVRDTARLVVDPCPP